MGASDRTSLLCGARLALVVGLLGCNPILGLDEPQLAETTSATSTTDPTMSNASTGSGASTGSNGGGGAGGGAPTCADDCSEGCFEGVCGGWKPVAAAPNENLSCVLTFSGAVYCSGSNRFGGLGIPPDQAPDTCITWIGNGVEAKCSFEMRRVALPGPAAKIATGRHAVCAILDDGRLFCWGNNEHGQLGHPPLPEEQTCSDQTPCVPTPTEVTGLGAVVSVSMVSIYHTCAVTADDKLWCWGANTAGQLGNDVLPKAAPPYDVFPPFDVSAATAGVGSVFGVALANNSTCFNDSAGVVRCMGTNVFQQISTSPDLTVLIPTTVSGASATSRFAQSRYTRCIVPSGSTQLSCAGGNDMGLLQGPSDALPHPDLAPRKGLGSESIVAVGAGDYHFCSLDVTGVVQCWGGTFVGQVGNGQVGTIDDPDADGDGCHLENPYGKLPCAAAPQIVDFAGRKATKLFVGNNTTMAILEDFSVVGWGVNQGGQLGHAPGTLDDSDQGDTSYNDRLWCTPSPRPVLGLPTGTP